MERWQKFRRIFDSRGMKHLRRLIFSVTGTAIVGFILLNKFPAILPSWIGGAGEITVRVARAQRRAAPVLLRAKGELVPISELDVVSRLAGKVSEVRFNVGDQVSAGAIVAIVQANTLAQRIAEIEAGIRFARDALKAKDEQLDGAEKQLAHVRELYRQDLISRRDVEQAAATAETARARTELAQAHLAEREATLAQARTLQRFTRVTTPVSGVVVRRWVEAGATVAESSAILTVASVDWLRLSASVSTRYSADIRVGMDAKIADATAPERTAMGKVARVEPKMKDGQQVLDVEIRVASGGGQLRPGTRVEALISINKSESSIWFPRSVVMSETDKNYVYKFADGRALRQEVALGRTQNGEVEIARGLKEGDSVIVDQLNLLKPGARVRVVNTPGPRRGSRD